MGSLRAKLPNIAVVLAWLGVIGTILGIVGFFISDLPALFNKEPPGLTEDQIVATLAALQDERLQAQLELTRIALDDIGAANQATENALNQQMQEFQATVDAVNTQQPAIVATQNAVVAATATQQSIDSAATATRQAEIAAATATAESIGATETQTVLDITATSDFLAQITPTPTTTPTPTPTVMPSPTPIPVTDHRLLNEASLASTNDGLVEFVLQAARPIPGAPPDGLAYVWALDTDRDSLTGLQLQDSGIDMRIAATAQDNAWVGTVRTIQPDGTLNEPFFFFVEIKVSGTNMTFTLDPEEIGLPRTFDWVVRAEFESENYSFIPREDHNTFSW
nr:hypothetical protein [Anaerolineae bacterium]